MEKIKWINGQAGGTPLSAENLNQMQDNIEKAIDETTEVAEVKIITGQENLTNEYIDEKQVYCRDYIINNIPDNDVVEIDLGFGATNVTFWKILGVIQNLVGSCFPLSSGDINGETNATVRLSLNTNTSKINLRTVNSNFVGGQARILVYYTKNQ